IQFWGDSFACGPQGEWRGRAGETAETLVVDIDKGRSETVRRIWPFLRDRRIDAYRGLRKRFLD
ncbi:MAG: acyltransferase, partial [Sedimenticolaceae bacterium]